MTTETWEIEPKRENLIMKLDAIWVTHRERDAFDVRASFINFLKHEKRALGSSFTPEQFWWYWYPMIKIMFHGEQLNRLREQIWKHQRGKYKDEETLFQKIGGG